MKDEDKAVLWILRARREFNEEEHPRQFILPEINLQAASYIDMVDWSSQPCIMPPFTLDLTKATLLGVIEEPFLLPNNPSHTQAVERKVRVVTEAATKRVTQSSWHQLILQLEKSRKLVPKFNTKKDGSLTYENCQSFLIFSENYIFIKSNSIKLWFQYFSGLMYLWCLRHF